MVGQRDRLAATCDDDCRSMLVSTESGLRIYWGRISEQKCLLTRSVHISVLEMIILGIVAAVAY